MDGMEVLKIIIAAQTASQSALDALALAQRLNSVLIAMNTEKRDAPTADELALADQVFNGTDAELTAAIEKAKSEGR